MTQYVYGLVDPTVQKISYVGRTNDLEGRFDGHFKDVGDYAKGKWITKLKSKGIVPVMIILEELEDDGDVVEVEKKWIDMGVRLGWPLVNTIHGNGVKYSSSDIDRMTSLIADQIVSKHMDAIIEKVTTTIQPVNVQEVFNQEISKKLTDLRSDIGERFSKLNDEVRDLRFNLYAPLILSEFTTSDLFDWNGNVKDGVFDRVFRFVCEKVKTEYGLTKGQLNVVMNLIRIQHFDPTTTVNE